MGGEIVRVPVSLISNGERKGRKLRVPSPLFFDN